MARPNIVYIMTDQQSASAMSCAGNGDIDTPHMDALAGSGVRFERAYCAFPLCLPCRASMFTGWMPHELGIAGNQCPPLDEEVARRTLGRLLSDAGYACAYAGKTHLPEVEDEQGYGWETVGPWDDRGLADRAIEYIERGHDRPFFLTVSYDDPHNICEWARHQPLPYGDVADVATEQCPNLPDNFAIPPFEPIAIRREVRKNYKVHPLDGWSAEQWRHYRHAYFRLVERVDSEIGRILDALRRAGLEENTVVIFASDHGDGHGAHQLNQKSFLYDEQARVPFVVRAPDVAEPGRVERGLVNSALDLLPTVCDYAGVEVPDGLEGRSVRPLVGSGEPVRWREAVFVETSLPRPDYDGTWGRMVRTQRYKYVVYNWGRYREQLFDMERDPGEMVNLAVEARYAAVLEEHRDLLRQWRERTGDTGRLI